MASSCPKPSTFEDMIFAHLPVAEEYHNEAEDRKKWIQDSIKGGLQILITGRAGSGKSTLVNALVGQRLATVGSGLDPQTKNVKDYSITVEDVNVVVWDSPGLQDGSENEEEYLTELKTKCSNVDVVIYCLRITGDGADFDDVETRNDFTAIRKLTHIFGAEWWEHCIFVTTFSNVLEAILESKPNSNYEKKFDERLMDWAGKIQGALIAAEVPSEVINKIPVVPAGHIKSLHLPGWCYWLSKLWIIFLNSAKDRCKPAILKMNVHRLKRAKDLQKEDLNKEGPDQPIIVDEGLQVFKSIKRAVVGGTSAGGIAGVGVGSSVGLALLGPPGGGVGAVIGGVLGAGVGAVGGGLAAGILYFYWKKKKGQRKKNV